ncbi:MAG: type II toxin-antitoxin system RelE/ParE family toxin [Alphaproteobacteria bacterium]|nr:type II toxin-antitoxin system RelE/ParE family toxin [Alphaproteobacteria bacterium]MBU1525827.1 type II toxin-antitoxin system RelE/ParE family toxin [Alphaproteobacteria bacterium]MBU2118319.1 type II toxin-antitoxin system RelE/ParE family toxin [Alphaproteobacteria bacterium]MBU2350044.1 type II toxin-antitoxin system RelE/ParE family toxin [Alphaproteobacteria bacterium]MBU2383211.1 type II toxin-antitoxin system RelE/ParE family toxin [Alphaproteobacteria bacterium]
MRVVLGGRARADLWLQLDWLGSLSPRAAKQAEARIIAALRTLGEQPRVGRQVHVDGLREWSIHFGAYGYVLQYRILRDHIRVMRLYHGAQDRR